MRCVFLIYKICRQNIIMIKMLLYNKAAMPALCIAIDRRAGRDLLYFTYLSPTNIGVAGVYIWFHIIYYYLLTQKCCNYIRVSS